MLTSIHPLAVINYAGWLILSFWQSIQNIFSVYFWETIIFLFLVIFFQGFCLLQFLHVEGRYDCKIFLWFLSLNLVSIGVIIWLLLLGSRIPDLFIRIVLYFIGMLRHG